MDMPVEACEPQLHYHLMQPSDCMIFSRPVGDLGMQTSFTAPVVFYIPGETGNPGSGNYDENREQTEPTPHYQLEEIVVTGERTDVLLEPVTTTSYAITENEIERQKASSLDEVLNTMVSLRATTGEKNETRVYLRGLSPANYIILVDGTPIAYSPYDRGLDFQQVPATGIAKIIVSPNAPSLYGPNTMGGAINIITRKGTAAPYYTVTSELSDNAYKRINYNAGISRGGYHFSSAAEYRETGGFNLSDGSKRNNADFTGKNISFKAGKTAENFDISLFSSFIRNDDKGLPVSLNPEDRPRYWRFTYWDKDMAGLNAQYNMSRNFLLKSRIFYEKFTNNLHAYTSDSFSELDWSSTFDDDVYGGTIEGQYSGLNHNLAVAISGRRDRHKDQGDTGEPWLTSRENIYSMAFHDVSTIKNFVINVGSSLDFQEVTEAENLDIENDFLQTANPEFGIAYVGGSYKIRANVNRKTNFPTLQSLTSSRSGNPALNAEKAVKMEAGIDYIRHLTFSVSIFSNNIRDRIDRKSRNDPYENINKANIRGAEILVTSPAAFPLDLKAGYTYLDATDHLFGKDEREMPYVPDHNVRISAGKNMFGNRLYVAVMLDIVSRLPYTDRNDAAGYLDGYHDADCSIHYRFSRSMEFYIKSTNIFNRDIVEEAGFPRSGRRFFTGITFGK